MNDLLLIESFVENSVHGTSTLLATSNLFTETNVGTLQLVSRKEGLLSLTKLKDAPRKIMVKHTCSYWALIHQAMLNQSFCPIGHAARDSFYDYQFQTKPEGYQLQCSTAVELWKQWWLNERRSGAFRRNDPLGNQNLLVLNGGVWYPIQEMATSQGLVYIKTLKGEIGLQGSDMLVWFLKNETQESTQPQEVPMPAPESQSPYSKRYLSSSFKSNKSL